MFLLEFTTSVLLAAVSAWCSCALTKQAVQQHVPCSRSLHQLVCTASWWCSTVLFLNKAGCDISACCTLLLLLVLRCLLLRMQAVLLASMPTLQRWPTAMLPFTLLTLGTLLMRWTGQMPEQVEQLLLQWQQAAVAALQPRLHLLPASSYVQLLLGCSRLKRGMQLQEQQEVQLAGEQAGSSEPQQHGQQDVDTCLGAAVLQVSGLLDELGPDDCLRLMAAYGDVAGVGPALGAELMARLEPQLR
jgi:hypothetical protein